VEFLDKSRSVISRTHTTSSAPAPALTPATIALSSTAANIIQILHSDDIDPNTLLYYNATSLPALRVAAQGLVPFLTSRRDALIGFITASQNAQVSASEKTRKLWETRKSQTEVLLAVYSAASKEDSELNAHDKAARSEFIRASGEYWHSHLKKAFLVLNKEMIGPFALGEQFSIADLHLAPWLARIAFLTGCSASESGDSVVAKLEARIGDNFTFPKDFIAMAAPDLNADPALAITPGAKRAKLAAFWDEMKIRPSWKKAYGDELH